MPKTPQRVPESCPHDVRPGTTICLHCRHAERLVARERRRRYMLRSSAVGAVVTTLGAAGVLGAMVIRGHSPRVAEPPQRTAHNRPPQPTISVAQTPPVDQPAKPDSIAAKPIQSNPSVSSGNVTMPPAAQTTMMRAVLTPKLPEGRSDLPDGISATRTDSVVVLSFDTKLARTRMPDKFERFVRATLPTIYGASADSALARIPMGELARQGDLINDLPTRGLRIPTTSGGTIRLFPMTRPGQDGPLVTRYRVVVVKS